MAKPSLSADIEAVIQLLNGPSASSSMPPQQGAGLSQDASPIQASVAQPDMTPGVTLTAAELSALLGAVASSPQSAKRVPVPAASPAVQLVEAPETQRRLELADATPAAPRQDVSSSALTMTSIPVDVSASNPALEHEVRTLRQLLDQANKAASASTDKLIEELKEQGDRHAQERREMELRMTRERHQLQEELNAARHAAQLAETEAANQRAEFAEELSSLNSKALQLVAALDSTRAELTTEKTKREEDRQTGLGERNHLRERVAELEGQLEEARRIAELDRNRQRQLVEELQEQHRIVERQRQQMTTLARAVNSKEELLTDVTTFVRDSLTPFTEGMSATSKKPRR